MSHAVKISLHLTLLACLLVILNPLVAAPYTPTPQQVTDNVYAFIGPLDQRSEDNDGLNNNLGFIVADDGVILIDSGASKLGAMRLEKAIKSVTDKPVKWVVNTGGQDHRWLGNDYFASQGAQIIALKRTAQTQSQYAEQQMRSLQNFLGERLAGTEPLPATTQLEGDPAAEGVELNLGGETLVLSYTDAHYPGDSWVWLPEHSVIFTGDLVYVDRLVAMLPWSSLQNAQSAFKRMEELSPEFIVPGHGQVSDMAKAKRESGDYYDFLVEKVGSAAQEFEPMSEVINRYRTVEQFQHLEHFEQLHPANMNRTYLEFESL